MRIAFVPNDPGAGKPATRKVKPHPDRKAGQTGFTFGALPAQKIYAAGTPDFVMWQSREAALLTLAMWEDLAGPLSGWAGVASKKKLQLLALAGNEINAYYDRRSLSFFAAAVGGRTFYSGASTDVVAHETGHAILDAIRPDLWDSMFFETAAVHEAFGDCIAMAVALYDRETRRALLEESADLGRANFVEAWGEDLSSAVRGTIGSHHNAALPRRGLNAFQWQFNDSLPDHGPAGLLINEIHSFGQVFSGCFYDLIRRIYRAGAPGEAGLLAAAKAAGRLLAAGIGKAPHLPRFMQSVGRTMALEEETIFGGRHRAHIHDAFAAHGIPLGAAAMLAPRTAIGEAPELRIRARSVSMARPAATALRRHLHADAAARVEMRPLDIGGRRVAEVRHQRKVDLTGLAAYLTGVFARGTEPVLLQRSAGRAAILGSVPDAVSTEEEVRRFVGSLVRHKQIRHAQERRTGAKGAIADANARPTHEVARVGAARTLRRVRFACC
jgi:hypothetical protein